MIVDLPVDDETAAALQRVVLTEALRELSPLHRQVLSETILRDRTVSQAAQVLGIPVGTVKSRVYYALRTLQVVLAARGCCRESNEHVDVAAYAPGLLEPC